MKSGLPGSLREYLQEHVSYCRHLLLDRLLSQQAPLSRQKVLSAIRGTQPGIEERGQNPSPKSTQTLRRHAEQAGKQEPSWVPFEGCSNPVFRKSTLLKSHAKGYSYILPLHIHSWIA